MGAVAFGAILVALLLVILAGFVWQGARGSVAGEQAEYLISEAAGFVYERLSDRALAGVGPEEVRRILEWNLHFTQVVGPRDLGRPPVIGSGDGMEYVMERARAVGISVEPLDIAEVMTVEIDYLLEIGAVGPPVGEDSA